MKKLSLLFVAFALFAFIGFYSCQNAPKPAEEAAEEVVEEVVEEAVEEDSTMVDSVAAEEEVVEEEAAE